MVKELISRAEFARRAGVSAAAVTKACTSSLLAAMDGKRLDAAHPIAVEYLAHHARAQTPAVATGLDNLYEEAVQCCERTGRYTASSIQRELKVGYNRAFRILGAMKSLGVTGHKTEEIPNREPSRPAPAPKAPHVRGSEAARETKKTEALQRLDEAPDPTVRELPEQLEKLADWTLREVVQRWGTDTAFVDWLKAVKEIENVAEKRLKNAQARGELISRDVVKAGVIDTLDGAFTRMLTDGSKTIAVRAHALVQTGADAQVLEEFVAKQLSTFIKPTKAKIARVLRNA